MKASFDGLRQNIALNFNRVADEIKYQGGLKDEHKSVLRLKELAGDLRKSLGLLMLCEDKKQQPDDFNSLSDLELEEL